MSYSRRAAVYQVEYQEARDVPFVLSLLDDTVRRVIELPCGAGRLSRHIAGRVAALDVVDLEPEMVSRAVDAARAAGPECAVTGHVQDMRHLSLVGRADLAVIPREGLQLVPPDDGRKVLQAVAAHIAPGGRILVDLARFGGDGGAGRRDPDYFKPGQPDGVISPDWTRDMPGGGRLHRSSAQTDEGASILFALHYRQEPEAEQAWSSEMRIYRYSSAWVEASAPPGTRLEQVFGDYDRAPPGPGAPRILALYRKLPD
jgi:SAM-dependent methyltransferase